MATLTVRNLDDALVRRLRIQAAENGRSAEAEHREILRTALVGREQPSIPQQRTERKPLFRPERDRPPTPAELAEESRARKRAMGME
ncbi:MAG: antitoxin FitA [Mycobacterium sp.]|jgi:plasmid stability protein|nr:antitoxin FitA [Mycobacterium sp.]